MSREDEAEERRWADGGHGQMKDRRRKGGGGGKMSERRIDFQDKRKQGSERVNRESAGEKED